MAFYRRSRPIRRTAEEIAAEKAAKLAKSMTCQCCARDIFAEMGVIAHHGYERPAEGWQTASCMGARQLPFEVARDTLADYIVRIKEQIARVQAYRDRIAADQDTFRWTIRDKTVKAASGKEGRYGETTFNINRENFDTCYAVYKEVTPYRHSPEPTFEALKAQKLRELDGNLTALRETEKFQVKRYKGWVQTHRRGEEGELVWMPIDSTPVAAGIDLPEDEEGWSV